MKKAVAKDHSAAMTNLGWLYENGKGVAQDYFKAAALYKKAAEKGQPEGSALARGVGFGPRGEIGRAHV